MVYSLTWLPAVLNRAGLGTAEYRDWRSRGRAEMGRVRGVMIHHTAGARTGNMPSLDLLVRGRPDLNGPLAQLGLGRDGTFYILAAGRANHAGEGVWQGIRTGNSSFIGIEAENSGKADDPWPDVQMEALRLGVAAILQHIGASHMMVCGHREYALPKGRKPDPIWEMAPFRESVKALMQSGVPAKPLIPAVDTQARPTLRRDARGPAVSTLQQRLGIDPPTGFFGPVTEARLRAWQRHNNLVDDGIAGPATWAKIDPQGKIGLAVTTAGSPVAAPAAPAAPQPAPAQVAPGPSTLPVADDAVHKVRVEGKRVLSPDGRPFAIVVRSGQMANGETGVDRFVAANPQAGAGVSPSMLRALVAVMGNEGKLEAVNTYDDCFLSFGVMQWTAGQNGEDGELAALLARLQRTDSAAFDECFGRYGLGARAADGAMTGRLSLEGTDLVTAAAKERLRSKDWAYRFWRAGHHPSVRAVQIAHGASRIRRFIDTVIHGHAVGTWLTSELGIAMLLDQHVNRPGHVPATLKKALGELIDGGRVGRDATRWGQDEEDRLIDNYIDERASTSMTHSGKRAARLYDLVAAGKLSAKRGSYS
ncbi:N-acetylmuramoyl-L-alanine amidase [Sphingomonas sp. ID0503]|uniref:peptidoglycan recognition protein family protein n=1 Tax=Sphingomonas sp. ID0503 TaxID=3399691 RepID=UPI003AFA694D